MVLRKTFHQPITSLFLKVYSKQFLYGGRKEVQNSPVVFSFKLSLCSEVKQNEPKISFFQEVQSQLGRICEMGQVMRQAVQMDDQHYCSVKERLAQLEVTTLFCYFKGF